MSGCDENLKNELSQLLTKNIEQQKLLSLFDVGDSVLFKWNNDPHWSIEYVSKNVSKLLGYDEEEFLQGRVNFIQCIHQDDLQTVINEVKEGKNSPEGFFKHKPYRVITKSGLIKWVLDYTVLDKDEKGNIAYYIGYLVDITEQKLAQKLLEDSEYRWKYAIEGNKDGLWDWNIKTGEVYFSHQWKKMLGFEDHEIDATVDEWQLRIHPEDLQRIYKDIEDYFKGITTHYTNEHRVLCKDGTYKWIRDRGSIVQRDADGNPMRMIGTHTDITHERKLLNELETVKNRFQNMFVNHDMVMLLIDPNNGNILNANHSAVEFYGYEYDEIIQMNITQINQLPSETMKKRTQQIQQYKRKSFVCEHRLSNGEIKIVEIHSSPIETENGVILFSIIKDVTHEKTIENQLKQSLKNLEKFIETQENIVVLTTGKSLQFANKKFFDFFGFKDLETFKAQHECICDYFIENERFFHIKKIDQNDNWIEMIQTLPDSQRVVCMLDKNSQAHNFLVSVNKFDDNTMIISFSDISQTILENISLEKKVMHDKLTNAFSREFFEKNYQRFLQEYDTLDTKLALAIIDIDHFKHVNDQYGHDLGDEVLIEFVRTIQAYSRHKDMLIRWGGEEFIFLAQVNAMDDLLRVLEHVRKVIQLHKFPKVGNLTCSIGGTIYKENEPIERTIKRADEALYEAKFSGRNKVEIS